MQGQHNSKCLDYSSFGFQKRIILIISIKEHMSDLSEVHTEATFICSILDGLVLLVFPMETIFFINTKVRKPPSSFVVFLQIRLIKHPEIGSGEVTLKRNSCE